MTLQIVKLNPEPSKEDLRRMALGVNEVVKSLNSGEFKRLSLSSTGTPVSEDGLASIYYVDATDGNVIFNLRALVNVQDIQVTIKKIDVSANTVTITTSSTSELIDGSTNKVISSQNVSHDIHADDLTNWRIV